MLPPPLIIALILVFLLPHPILAFTPHNTFLSPPKRHSLTTTSHNVVFTRLSEDCLQALNVAQEQALLLDQSQIEASHLLLGITQHAGALQSTLDKYGISFPILQRTLQYLEKTNSSGTIQTLSLADFQDKTQKQLVYSTYLQERLLEAGTISHLMGAGPLVQTEHVFLALLHYQDDGGGETGNNYAATRGDDCEAMEVLYHMDDTLEASDICQDLLLALMDAKNMELEDNYGITTTTTNKKPKAKPTKSTGTTNTADVLAGGSITTSTSSTEPTVNSTLLQQYGTDLTQMAADGDLDIVHGREEEIQSCLRILLRRRKNNVCIIGEAGTGKTSIAEALAQRLVSSGDAMPPALKGYKMIALETSGLLAGTKFRGAFEERLRGILDEIVHGKNANTILFLDELHTLMGSGATDGGGTDAANLLKPYLARGQVKVVAATTIVEYNRKIAKDPAMDRRFQPVLIREPSIEATIDILQALLPSYRDHHQVEFEPESLEAAARLSDRYIADRFLPDKAIDLLDEAGALATLRRVANEPPPIVNEALIMEIVSDWSSIPVGALEMDEMERLEKLEGSMGERVKGQERAVTAVAKAIRRARTGVRDPRRPVASFLFAGPTGTG